MQETAVDRQKLHRANEFLSRCQRAGVAVRTHPKDGRPVIAYWPREAYGTNYLMDKILEKMVEHEAGIRALSEWSTERAEKLWERAENQVRGKIGVRPDPRWHEVYLHLLAKRDMLDLRAWARRMVWTEEFRWELDHEL